VLSSSMNLPKGPESLCFDKDVFIRDDFDVDQFVAECRKQVQLEELREDLELYYKLLKTAMVELINKDYADFVNLSTNLVGMDKALNQLSVPLGQLREEVLKQSLRSCVSGVIQAIDDQLIKHEDLQHKKVCVMRLIQVVRSVEKIEKILHSQSSKDSGSLENSPLLAGQILERIATEFNHLQFHAVQSKGMPLLDKVRPRIAGITAMLQQSLEGLLIEGLHTCNVEMVRHCLRTYATIDKTRDAEALVGQVLVKPYMDQVIVEDAVQASPNGLELMYLRLLEFVPHHCRLLREVTGGAVSSGRADAVPGYDFLVNSVWPEMVRAIEERLSFLFNPGNPDVFYAVGGRLRPDRASAALSSTRPLSPPPPLSLLFWVYRYKETAGGLEKAISDGLQAAPAGGTFHLQVSEVLWSCLVRCWSDGVYLAPLAHRLWKLTLQLYARYARFIDEVLTKPSTLEVTKEPSRPPPSSASSTSSRTSVDEGGSEGGGPVGLSTKQLVFIAADIQKLQEKGAELLEVVRRRLDAIGFKNFAVVEEALSDSRARLDTSVPSLNSRMSQHLTERCCRFLKSAAEVPRLYRRTNKEVPVRASAYMDNALQPLHQLLSDSAGLVSSSTVQWLRVALSECTHRYCETISEVLSSVRKMEESLKRLKQARKGAATAATAGANGGPTDDGKIRLQLALDVEYLGEQIQKMGLQPADISMFSTLMDLVREARELAEQN
uniref:Conserved oligomeric Golgi complex subunit 2 n=1 Tax=Tetraodon nigroviridis TaxID=99883 RepID=H3DI24_TETNG